MKTFRLALLILVIAMVIAACGGEDTSTADPAAESSGEEAPYPADEPAAPAEEPSPPDYPAPAEEPPPAQEPAEAEAETAEASMSGSELTGSIWTLITLNEQPLLPRTSITAEFNEDGKVSGSSGCNNYTAAYEADGSNITINMSPAARRTSCTFPPAGLVSIIHTRRPPIANSKTLNGSKKNIVD